MHAASEDELIIEVGVFTPAAEIHLKFVAWFFAIVPIIGLYIKTGSILSVVLGVTLLSPFIAFFLIIALPNHLFATNIYINRRTKEIRRESRRLLPSTRRKFRDYREVTAILLVQDTTHYGTSGRGLRFRLFLCLDRAINRRRVLFIDNVESAEVAAKAVQQISEFTGWTIEFLTLDRTITDRDVCWESW